ncbi:MAG: type III-A CRISPR-associated RAMP protein Csm3 [Chloroflexota bacterium]|nr:MAG: type III-A CRISPR-associated RAMP protein Csm3 [Chloroflexota bacterium]
MSNKLLLYRTLRGTLTCLSGLRIGGSKESIEIGGLENTIIRHPITDLPYIPGSSIKGKMRSLLEQRYGIVEDNGEPSRSGTHIVCRVFGPHKNVNHTLGPTRILVRDANLTDESRKWLEAANKDKGVFYAEVKTENLVNRKTGTAEHPRTLERVPADTKFDFEIAVRIFEGDNEIEILNLVKEGLNLLQQDYLGSSGSRGYGKIALDYQVI